MTPILGLLTGAGLAEKWAKLLEPVLLILAALAALWGIYALIHHSGEQAGAAKVTAKVEQQHVATVAAARHDEQSAQATTARIAESTARSDAVTSAYVQSTIQELHHALDAVPPAAPAAVPPPAPVDGLRDNLNAAIERANRSAGAAAAAGGNDADGDAETAHR